MTDQITICYIKYVSKIYNKLHAMEKIIFTKNESAFIKMFLQISGLVESVNCTS